jgi:allantoinase
MTSPSLALRSRHVVTPDGVRAATVIADDGKIAAIEAFDSQATARDLGDAWLLPGLVDTHVHINEPGRADWEGFETATLAAAAGGVTTLVDMPLNSIPATTTVEALRLKRAAAAGKCRVDVHYWGGVVPGNADQLEALAAAGVRGFKCFLVPSGVEEFEHVGESDLREAMPIITRLGLPLLFHAELAGPIEVAARIDSSADPRRHATWLASRPPEAEVAAIRMTIGLVAEFGCRVHIVHLSAAEALADLREARDAFLPITVETCPHYLTLADEEIPDGATPFKCAPPIRGRANRDALWEALEAGDIDLIASDHSPCPPDLKGIERGDFFAAWGGIASLELGLPVVWTEASDLGFGIDDVVRWMSERPAALAGLADRKGRIAVGADADLVAWEPDVEWTVDANALHQRHAITPYAGRRLRGRVARTWVAGEAKYSLQEDAPARHR